MANFAFNQRMDRATVGDFRIRWASQIRQSRLDLSTYEVLILRLGEFARRRSMLSSVPKITRQQTSVIQPPSRVLCTVA